MAKKGDFDWASRELRSDLGNRWAGDKMGHVMLHNALYQKMSPDLHYKYYEAFISYMGQRYHYDFEDMFDWDGYRLYYEHRSG